MWDQKAEGEKDGIAEAKRGEKRGWLRGDGWLSTPCEQKCRERHGQM